MNAFLITLAVFLASSTSGLKLPDCPIPQFDGERLRVIFYANADDCSKYFQCIDGRLYNGSCSEGLVWNPTAESCDWPSNYKCAGGSMAPAAATATSRHGQPVDASAAGVTCPPPGGADVTFQPHEEDCRKYWACDNGRLSEAACPDGRVWVPELRTCDWEYLHPCYKLPKWARSWWSWGTLDRHHVVEPQPVGGAAN